MIAVSLTPQTVAEAHAALSESARLADLAELRLDYLPESFDLASLLAERPCPVIVTYRPAREGGCFQGQERVRLRVLQEACALGAEHVDVEWDSVRALKNLLSGDSIRTKLIVSYHDFRAMPQTQWTIHQQLRGQGADVVKIAGMARRLTDALQSLELLTRAQVPTISIAMGTHGVITRILALRYPSCYLTFATLGNRQVAAPGQIPIKMMREVFQAQRIGPATMVYGTLGFHSGDATEWRQLTGALREAGLDAVYVPLSLAADDDLRECLERLRRLGLRGARLAEPFHTAAAQAADRLETSAQRHSRADTLYLDGEKWVGVWLGREEPLRLWLSHLPARP